ncbi:MAG: hypothetical protein AAGF81_16410 [Pseudomonadota bacterium]
MKTMAMNWVKLLVVVLVLSPALNSAAAQGAADWGTPYEKFFAEGTERVKTFKGEDGSETREVITKGGVQIRQVRKNGEISTATADVLHGPVLCFWEIAVTVRAALDVCEETNRPELAKRLDATLGKLNQFIMTNGLEQASKAQIDEATAARFQRFRKSQAAPETGRVSCSKAGQGTLNFVNAYLADMEKKTDQDYQAGIDKLLSVPRLPAMNPCL